MEETGTPEAEYEADDAVDSQPEPELDFDGVPEPVLQVLDAYREQIQLLTDLVTEMQERDEPSEEPALEVAALPEGARRYVHTQFTEALLIRVPAQKLMQNGTVVNVRQVDVDFSQGLYTSYDAEEQEWIENHPDFLTGAIMRDDSARPGPVLPGLVEGVRSSEPLSTTRAVLQAQMN